MTTLCERDVIIKLMFVNERKMFFNISPKRICNYKISLPTPLNHLLGLDDSFGIPPKKDAEDCYTWPINMNIEISIFNDAMFL